MSDNNNYDNKEKRGSKFVIFQVGYDKYNIL